MSKFADCLGREWSLNLTVGALADVRRSTDCDLGKALKDEGALVELLFSDPVRLVEVLWVLVRSQAEGATVLCGPDQGKPPADAEGFARGFDGPTLERAAEALLDAVADFFPRSRVGRALRERMRQGLDRMDDAIIRQIQGQESNSSAGSSPESVALTRAP